MIIANRTGIAAARSGRAELHTPSQNWDDKCQMFCRTRVDAPPGAATAREGWETAELKHRVAPEDAQFATIGYFRGPGPSWHAVFMLTGGRCLSNDVIKQGAISLTTVDYILKAWPSAEWLGVTWDVNNRQIHGHGPDFSADAIARSQRGDHEHQHGEVLKQELASFAGKHGMNLHNDHVGEPMRVAVAHAQRQLGWRPTGVVGPSLLAYLADRRHAFTARP